MSEPENPFSLQRDNKRFFLEMAKSNLEVIQQEMNGERQLLKKSLNNGSIQNENQSRIKNLNRELQQLAKKRQQILFKDSQLDYIFRKQSPTIRLEDFLDKTKDKKFRVRAILKQKKQTLHEFLNKKKEIFLSKMNINTKKQQTNKLEDYIKDQKETLKARQLYYKNDVQFMNKFIAQIKKQSEDAQIYCEAQLKIQQSLTAQLTAIQTQIERKQNLISKAKQDFMNLNKYKSFLDKFLIYQNSSWRPYVRKQQKKDVVFLTEKLQIKQEKIIIKFSPENLLDIFNQIEENNIGQIQNLHNTEQELEKVAATEKKIRDNTKQMEQDYKQRIKALQKSVDTNIFTNNRLKQIKKNNHNKIKITDDEDIDLEKISAKILEIYREINPKYKSIESKHSDSKELKRCMTQIQHQMVKLWEQIKRQRQANPARNQQIQKQIKLNHKKQNLIRKQEISKELQFKRQSEQLKKRDLTTNEIPKGRKPMTKVLLQKPIKKQKVQVVTNKDNDLKYFRQDGDSQEQN